MRGLEKTAPDGADTQTQPRTWRLYDQWGRVGENVIGALINMEMKRERTTSRRAIYLYLVPNLCLDMAEAAKLRQEGGQRLPALPDSCSFPNDYGRLWELDR